MKYAVLLLGSPYPTATSVFQLKTGSVLPGGGCSTVCVCAKVGSGPGKVRLPLSVYFSSGGGWGEAGAGGRPSPRPRVFWPQP